MKIFLSSIRVRVNYFHTSTPSIKLKKSPVNLFGKAIYASSLRGLMQPIGINDRLTGLLDQVG